MILERILDQQSSIRLKKQISKEKKDSFRIGMNQRSSPNFKLCDAGTLVQLVRTPYEKITNRCCTDAY